MNESELEIHYRQDMKTREFHGQHTVQHLDAAVGLRTAVPADAQLHNRILR